MILQMVEKWERGKNKIVLATRAGREDGFVAKWTSRIFYRLMQKFAIPNMPDGGFDFFAIDRTVVDLINEIDERNSFLQGQVLWTGYTPVLIPYTRRIREIGRSRWTLASKIKYFADGFVSYSEAPLRLITLVGLFVSILSFTYAALILFFKIFLGLPVEGWAPIMITLLMLGGIQLVVLGVIGEYIWRTADETRKRPAFVIEETLEISDDGGASEAPEGMREDSAQG
ncbi:MAG: hypothetical protein JRH17_23575 [Deltaproteobacteria bacterium]|nr:hypothetical protein [Deltaproteobacteria bacterium]